MPLTDDAKAADLNLAVSDLGPLAWVLDELRKSLDGAVKALRRYVRDADLVRGSVLPVADSSHLRIARQQLHQAVGALEMVGLSAPAQLLRGMEAAVQRFVEHPELCREEHASSVERASFALSEFLEALLRGKAVSAVALFGQYQDVQQLAGVKQVHPVDLWEFPWRWIDPVWPAGPALAYGPAVRPHLERGMLRLVKGTDPAAARAMRDVTRALAQGQSAATALQPRVFWKLAAAFFEAQALGLSPNDLYAKRMASRVLTQYSVLARGESEVPTRLAQELLFFSANAGPHSAVQAPLLDAVRQAYGLTQSVAVDYASRPFGRYDPALLVQARKRIGAVKESWSALSGGDTHRIKAVSDQFALVADSLVKLHPASQPLAQQLTQAVQACVQTGKPPTPELAMEVATAILYLEAAFEDLDPADPQLAQRTTLLARRLDQVRQGLPPQPLEVWMEELYRRVSERQTMGSVVGELRITASSLEKSLDQFFRKPADRSSLDMVPGQLSQMRGVLSLLGLDQAALAALRMRESVDRFISGAMAHDSPQAVAIFETLGNSLGALGFMIDMLNYQPALAKKLFAYDEASGEFKSLVGRAAPLAVAEPAPAPTPVAAAVKQPEVVAAQVKPVPPPARPPVAAAPIPSVAATPATPVATPPVPPVAAAPAPSVAAPAVAGTLAPLAAAAEEDDDDLLEVFLEEAREVIPQGLAAVRALMDNPGDAELQTTLRRAFHTLKGSSRMVGLDEFGQAAWAMEQAMNTLLAEHQDASPKLCSLSEDALQEFARWLDDVATHADADWQARGFQRDSQTLQDEIAQRKQAARTPVPAAAPTPPTPAPPTDHFDATQMLQVPVAPAPSASLVAQDDSMAQPGPIEIDFGNLLPAAEHADSTAAAPTPEPELAFTVTPELAPPPVPEPVEPEPVTIESVPEPVEPVPVSEVATEAAAATSPEAATEPVSSPEPLFDGEPEPTSEAAPTAPQRIPTLTFDFDLELTVAPEAEPVTPETEAVPPPEAAAEPTSTPALQPEPLFDWQPEEAELVAPEAEPAPEAEAVLPLEAAAEPTPTLTDLENQDREEDVKHIGDLRIPIPLYNIYLNEADEWSRRLETELAEWALELEQPIAATSIQWAHSLAGSSATVGFTDLSGLARLIEHALEYVQWQSVGQPAQAQTFNAATQEVRRLLHQFAAGFLKQPDPDVLDGLRAMLESDLEPGVGPAAVVAADQVELADWIEPSGWSTEQAQPEPGPAPDVEALDQPLVGVNAAQGAIEVIADVDRPLDPVDPDLFPIFEDEADELLPRLAGALRQWSLQPHHADARRQALRALHTLKGSARLAGALHLGDLAHQLESTIEPIDVEEATSAEVEPLLGRYDALVREFERLCHRPTDQPSPLAAELAATEPTDTAPATPTPMAVAAPPAAAPLADDSSQPALPPLATAAASAPALPDAAATPQRLLVPERRRRNRPTAEQQATVRVRAPVLDRLVNQAGEIMMTRSRLEVGLGQLRGSLSDLTSNLERLRSQLRDVEVQAESQMQTRMAQTKDAAHEFDPLEFDRFTRMQELTRMLAESVNDVATVQRSLQRTVESTEDNLVAQARQTRELQRDLLRTRMIEFDSIAERLYGVVRQAERDTGKQARLQIEGGGIEIDRNVLERMTAVFEHLLRNAVAHGIEAASERTRQGKPTEGVITLSLQQHGNDVDIDLADDGAGLNLPRIREKAIAQGLLAEDQELSPEQATELIFRPGFSTAGEVTELSGRGVGTDVVRSEVTALGGRVACSSQTGQGTRFSMELPLTTAVTQVVMLRIGEMAIGVPSNVVEIVRRVPAQGLELAYQAKTFTYADTEMPFYWSGALLQVSAASAEPKARHYPVLVLRSAGQRVAIHVDEVLGNQEVVVKNLGPQLSRLPGLASMTVLASGAVVLIYNPVALAAVYHKRATEAADAAAAEAATSAGVVPAQALVLPAAVAAPTEIPLVLVVDDSITVRRVTQRLLRREGYRVALANDGLMALQVLHQERPAVVLSDIEMPRMDGFDLARQIRADAELRDLPIIMITSRLAEKHRDHARELGVNHYLGKPYPEDELLNLVRLYANAGVVTPV